MERSNSSQVREKRKRRDRRVWTEAEEEALVDILEQLVVEGWRGDNGTFKSGYSPLIEKKLEEKFPGCSLKADPHIESKLKVLKKQYNIITDMIGCNGMGWNEELKCPYVESDDLWESYLKREPRAKGLRNKPFPLYKKLGNLFRKVGATGTRAEAPCNTDKGVETPADAVEDLEDEGNTVNSAYMSKTSSAIPNSEQTTRKMRRSSDSLNYPIIELGSVFRECFEIVGKRMDLFAERVGQAKDLSADRRRVLYELKKMGYLAPKDRMIVAKRIIERPEYVDLFFSCTADDKVEFVATLIEKHH